MSFNIPERCAPVREFTGGRTVRVAR